MDNITPCSLKSECSVLAPGSFFSGSEFLLKSSEVESLTPECSAVRGFTARCCRHVVKFSAVLLSVMSPEQRKNNR